MRSSAIRSRTVARLLALALLATPLSAQADKLTLYTSQPDKDAAETVAAFKNERPNTEVEIFRSGTTEVLGKLAAEFAAGQPRPDVILIADAVSMETLKKDGRLQAYPGANVEGFPQGAYDPDRTYFGTKLITSGIVHHKGAKLVPTSWSDLARPELKGQIVMASPFYSGAAVIVLGAITQHPGLGWKFFEALAANETVAAQGNGAVLKSVASGEKPYGIIVEFMALNARAKGSPIEFVVPAEGVVPVTEPVAILKTAANPAGARAFIDFLLSEKGQKVAAKQGYMPALEGVASEVPLPAGTKLKLMPMDVSKILASTGSDKDRFGSLFGR
jgi:iron(III) transport system substrate-binding protein